MSEGTSDGTEQQRNSRAALGQQDLLFQKEPSCSGQFLELAAKSLHRLGSGMSPHRAAVGASQALYLSIPGLGLMGFTGTRAGLGCGIYLERGQGCGEPRAGLGCGFTYNPGKNQVWDLPRTQGRTRVWDLCTAQGRIRCRICLKPRVGLG